MTSTSPAEAVDYRAPGVRDVDLSRPLPSIPPGNARVSRPEHSPPGVEFVLVRWHTEPLGLVKAPAGEPGLSGVGLAELILAELGAEIARRADGPVTAERLAAGLPATGPVAFLTEREQILLDAPPIAVAICTRSNPDGLRGTLASLRGLRYPRWRVLVADNGPEDARTRAVVDDYAGVLPVTWVPAPEPGLSRARNVAIANAPGENLAFIDDDEVVDPHWLAEIARALVRHPEAGVVTGVIVPAEITTSAQALFEEFGGHSKGRGFRPARFGPATWPEQHPLFPLPPFGTGANMVFRPEAIAAIEGFDPALGAGTPARAGEDTHAFTRYLLRGGTIAYQPTAVTRHVHRPDLAGLEQQLHGYGTGLTAFYASLLRERPALLWPLLRLAPAALRALTRSDSERNKSLTDEFPREVLRANLRGMLRGPLAYVSGRRSLRRPG